MNQPIDSIWQKIETIIITNKPNDLEKFNQGATEEEILELEQQISTKLPDDLRKSLKIHNGNKGVVLSDGRDLIHLFSASEIKEEFDYQYKHKKQLTEDYAEIGHVFNDIEIPVWKYPDGDQTNINLQTGELEYLPHDGEKGKTWSNFYSFLKEIADNLESGRLYYGEYGMEPLHIDDIWEKLDQIESITENLNINTADYTGENETYNFNKFIKEKSGMKKIGRFMNEHFYRTYDIFHNGQKTQDAIFFDGEEHWSLLPYHQITNEFEDIKIEENFVVPIFKNHETGRKIFIALFKNPYNGSFLYKKTEQTGEFVKLDKDLVDILMETLKKHI
jgi:hypothetical protein